MPALSWLEKQQAPSIVAPIGEPSRVKCRFYVPDNLGDQVAASWSRGGTATIADYRYDKDVRPTHLRGDAVHFLYRVSDTDAEFVDHRETLFAAARSITHLGWGIDMVAGTANVISEDDSSSLSGEHWRPVDGAGNSLRIPTDGTLRVLVKQHDAFLNRVTPNRLETVPPLSKFEVVNYRRPNDSVERSFAAFSILNADASAFRPFDPARKGLTVAGMVRCATKLAAERSGWPRGKVAAFILGHSDSNGSGKHVAVGPQRFAYLPLPTIEGRGEGKARVVGSVRRVMLTCFADGCEDEIAWARHLLSGQELVDESTRHPVALLSLIPPNDKVVRCYMRAATTWATVTPVVLPGYDDPEHLRRRAKNGKQSSEQQRRILDRLSGRIDGLLRKAITQAGFPQELADHAVLEWQKVGFWPGSDLADRYGTPDHLQRFPRFHVKIRWRNAQDKPGEIAGPLCFGGGRFYGLGLFAAL